MDKSICPDCGGPVQPFPVSGAVGYYCGNEDKFIGEYYKGPTEGELRRKWKREDLLISLLLYSPVVVFLVAVVIHILGSW